MKRAILSAFLVPYEDAFSGINLCKFCKTFPVFYTNVVLEVTLSLVLGRAFLLMCLVRLQLRSSRRYTEWIPAFGEKAHYALDHREYHHNQGGNDKNFIYCDKCSSW